MNKDEKLEKAIANCKKLWRWEEEHPMPDMKPGERKRAWPGWKKYKSTKNLCFACEYSYNEKTNEIECEKCFLLPLWIRNYKNRTCDCLCEEDESPYQKWKLASTDKEQVKYAKMIADYCEKLEVKLRKK